MVDKQRLRTFVLGGAVGALVGILLAPRSGRELRGSLANRAGEARERSRERYFGAQEQMRERLAEAREGPSKPRPDVPRRRKPMCPGPASGTYPKTWSVAPRRAPTRRGRRNSAGR